MDRVAPCSVCDIKIIVAIEREAKRIVRNDADKRPQVDACWGKPIDRRTEAAAKTVRRVQIAAVVESKINGSSKSRTGKGAQVNTGRTELVDCPVAKINSIQIAAATERDYQ